MKNGIDSTAVGRAPEVDSFSNRKLIRPSLSRTEHRTDSQAERRERAERNGGGNGAAGAKKTPPPEQTHAENFYYQKQMQAKTPMVVVLNDGEEIHGLIEWYDKSCIKLTRNSGANLLIYKPAIKYMYKAEEITSRR